jgi:hypothetical protein
VFFLNKENEELFAVTKTDETKGEVTKSIEDYAKELYFPDEEIIIFPATIGITGEMH